MCVLKRTLLPILCFEKWLFIYAKMGYDDKIQTKRNRQKVTKSKHIIKNKGLCWLVEGK